jgi:hypothetical protein
MMNTLKLNELIIRQSHRIMALMLLTLHAYLVWDKGISTVMGALFIGHYILFLLWQPIWHSPEKISKRVVLVLIAVGVMGYLFMSWWIIAGWLSLLFGLLGGRIFSEETKSNRIIHILAATYLLAMLLLQVVPKLLRITGDIEAASFLMIYLMPALPLAILFLDVQAKKNNQAPILDFFYTLLLMLVAIILVLASFAIGSLNQVNYVQVMFSTIFGLAAVLIAFSFLWKPSTSFSGVELLMSRYLLSIGMPFEQWIKNISNLAELQSSANGFMQAAMKAMTELPWVVGASWIADDTRGKLGETSEHSANFNFKDFHMTLYSKWQISPALYVHVKLLTQIMGEFYDAKRREEIMRQNAYMQAFYETGSRLTHDIKNILQSVGTLISAAELTDQKDNQALVNLIRKQLPMLNQRIAATLDKLKAPGDEKKRMEKITAWWKNLQMRHQQHDIEFVSDQLPKSNINAEVLDSIVDNLLSNAIEKTKYQPNIKVKVEMVDSSIHGFYIEVTDTGRAMDDTVANSLFKKHIASHNGLGVGLYHAGKDAKQAGYELSLASNLNGAVTFKVGLSFEHSSQ